MSEPLLKPEEIKLIRAALGYSEAEMAQQLGIQDRLTFNAFESGKTLSEPKAMKKLLSLLHKKSQRHPKLKHLQEVVSLRQEKKYTDSF